VQVFILNNFFFFFVFFFFFFFFRVRQRIAPDAPQP
jgi:hypothetical protein